MKLSDSKQDALNYLTWTYFFRRLLMNPNYYNLESIEGNAINDYLSELVQKTVKARLQKLQETFKFNKFNEKLYFIILNTKYFLLIWISKMILEPWSRNYLYLVLLKLMKMTTISFMQLVLVKLHRFTICSIWLHAILHELLCRHSR